ncbi:RRT2 Diphthine methyltransferase [Candida maltosa Xu316]
MFDIPTLTPLFFFEAMHELECWTGSFGSSSGSLSNIVYTGGDDACLIAHDIRTNRDVWTLKRGHDAGIVSVLSPGSNGWNMNGGYSLWTGSYDDHLRVWDLRVVDRLNPELIDGYVPKLLNKEDLGGGVWRLIPSPVENDDRVLSCCMYEGVRVIDVQGEERFKVSRFFKEDHESMCYGGDWSSDGKYIATCSFYDNVVQIWSPDECV